MHRDSVEGRLPPWKPGFFIRKNASVGGLASALEAGLFYPNDT